MLKKIATTALLGGSLLLLNGCALLKALTGGRVSCLGARESGEWTTTDLVAQGNVFLSSALPSTGSVGGYENAASCYLRAKQLSKEDYSVNLGLGVAYLSQAKHYLQNDKKARADIFLSNAKKSLGIAYIVRQGHLEPIYYLAEVAVLENTPASLRLAALMLKHLEKEKYKPGPVFALMGFMMDKSNSNSKAKEYYLSAIQQNWPVPTVNYAVERYLDLEK